MRKLIMAALAVILAACSNSGDSTPESDVATRGYKTEAEALAATETQLSCVKTIRTPISRGRGSGLEGKYKEETLYFPGYLRGDINADGIVDDADAKLAVQRLFKPENFECPRTADVGGYPQTLEPDGFFTSQDVNVWNEFRHTGIQSWPEEVICGYDCPIPNHQSP